VIVGCLIVLLSSLLPLPARADTAALSVIDYHYVSGSRVGRSDFDYTYQITVRNSAEALNNVVATAASSSSRTTIIQGVVNLGDLGANSTKKSAGTFTFRQDRRFVFDPASISWSLTADPVTPTNTPPVASAGPGQNVFTGTLVTLDGSGSSDADGDPLSFAWNFRDQPPGSAAALSDPTQTRPTFLADQPGRYELDLTVFDGTDSSEPDSVIINTEDMNSDPVAKAGPDQANAFVGAEVVLDGSGSSDIDGDELVYLWAFQARPPGSAAALLDATTVSSRFTPDLRGEYVLSLTVSDGRGGSGVDYVVVSTEFTDRPPTANAGPDQSVLPKQQVMLDGSGSSDPDNDAITAYRWSFVSRPAGSAADLLGSDTALPSFVADRSGDYVIQLVVTANGVDSAPDTVTVTTENVRPVANAGPDQTVSVDAVVSLDGNASTDANGDPLSFDWSLLTRPDGSTAVLSLDMTPTPQFTADRPGEFVVQLVVNDGTSASDPDTAVITAVNENRPPIAIADADALSVPVGTTVVLDGSASSDPDGDAITYEWSLTVPAGSSATLSSTNGVGSTFVADQPGIYTVTLIVRDDELASGPSSVTVTATAPNRAPSAAASASPTTLMPPGVVALDGSGSADPDDDELSYQWSLAVPAGSAAVLSATTDPAPSFTADVVGEYVATLVVNDGELASAPVSVTIVATSDNQPPTLATVGDRVAFVGETLVVQLFATDPDAGDLLTFSLVSGPTGIGVNAATGVLTFTPNAGQLGGESVTVRVTDGGGLSDDEVFAIEVRQDVSPPPANAPPNLEPIADQQLIVGQALGLQTVAADPDAGDTLAYSLPSAPAGMTISATGLIAWTPLAEQLGPFDVTVQVLDPSGAAALRSFIVTVRPINRAPTAVDDLYQARIRETTSISAPGVLGNDTDPDGDEVTAALVSTTSRGALDLRADGSFEYTPTVPTLSGVVELEVQCQTLRPDTAFQSAGTVAVGDVDNDGQVEMVGISTPLSVGNGLRPELWILNASDCTPELERSMAVSAAGGLAFASHLGLLDIDGDGDLEIIGVRNVYPSGGFDWEHLLAIHHDGTLAWPGDGASGTSALLTRPPLATSQAYREGAPSFADLDGNGTVEIIMAWRRNASDTGLRSGLVVYNSVDGSLLWDYIGPEQRADADYKPPVIADLDLDGTMEIIVHTDVVSHLGTLEFRLPVAGHAGTTSQVTTHLFTSIANFDDDPQAEILARDRYYHYLFNHDGSQIWRQAERNTSDSQMTVADLDGDGEVEFAYNTSRGSSGSAPGYMVAFDTDGSLLWSHANGAGPAMGNLARQQGPNATAFDANGDGAMDLVIQNDDGSFSNAPSPVDGVFVFDGRDGSVLAFLPIESYEADQRFVTIADVDGDGAPEIISSFQGGVGSKGATVVWQGTAANPLPPAPTIRNQLFFNPAYVDERTGEVLANPVPHWLQPGLNGWHLVRPRLDPLVATTDSFTYVASDGALSSNPATVTFEIQPAGQPPAFLTQPDKLTTVGFPYEYAPRVVDADPGDSISFTLPVAPAGMTISSTGRLNWLPEAEGSYPVTIIASDTIGFATPQTFTLVVGQPVVVPDVVGQAQAAAEATLAGANLLAGAVRTSTHPTVAAGDVFEQAPAAGAVSEFGGLVDLLVSTGPAPEDVDDDGDGFSESEGDCDDGDPTIAPGAADAAGDGIDSDCDGIDGNLTLSSILVSADKATVLTSQTVTLTATGVFTDGTSQNLTGLVTWVNGPTFSSASPGTFTVSASRAGVTGSTTIEVRARVEGDSLPPAAVIATPAANSVVTEPVEVTGTATDGNFLKYELAYAPAGETTFTTLVTGQTPVANGLLGQFDPTLLVNDLYTIRLTVFDAGGNQTVAEVTVQVDGNTKVGSYTLSFTDLEIPMAGIPITVTRTYDSRDKTRGDFGVGWRLGVQTLRIRNSRDLGTGWRVDQAGLAFALSPEGNHSVNLTLPDGKIEVFDLVVSPTVSPLVPFPPSALSAKFVPRSGTLGTLQSLDNNTLTIFSSQPGEVELSDDVSGRSYNPSLYRYTTSDGTQIDISTLDGVRSLRDPNGNTLTFNRDGISHSAGKSVVFARDELGRIVSITDPMGRRQEYRYDGNDDLRTHVDATGAQTSFQYDRRHYLQEIVDPLGNRAVRNEYSDDGRLIASTDALGNRIEFAVDLATRQQTFTDSNGNIEIANFDARGNIVLQERIVTIDGVPTVARTAYTYDAQGNEISVVDPDGVRQESAYDARSNLTRRAVDPLGSNLASTYVYDSKDRIVSSTEPSGLQTTYQYDAKGNLVSTRDQLGNTTSYFYDAKGRRIAAVDANGGRVETQYTAFGQASRKLSFDASGRLMSRTDFEYDANGNNTRSVSYADPAAGLGPRVTTNAFDAQNRLIQSSDALGNVSRYEYDALDQLLADVDPFGNRTEYEYDTKGQRITTRAADGTTVRSAYDAGGNETRKVDQLGRETTYQYDEAGRLVRTTSPAGTTTRNIYTPGGRLRASVDELGARTDYEYDPAGRRTLVRLPSVEINLSGSFERPTIATAYDAQGAVGSITDANGNTTSFEYDAIGRQVRTVFADGSSVESVHDGVGNVVRATDQLGFSTDFAFDGANRLITVVQPPPDATTSTPVTSSSSYDSTGNTLSQTDGLGRVTRLAYNALGRAVERVLPGGQRETLVHERGLRLRERVDFNGAAALTDYDELGRVTSQAYSDGSSEQLQYTATGELASILNAQGEIRYAYDGRDNVVAVTQADGTQLSYAYTATGAVERVEIDGTVIAQYAYDSVGRLTSVTTADGVTRYGYDAAGNQTVVSAANGARTERQFDSLNRVVRIQHFGSDASLIQDLSYAYDPRGMKTRSTELDGSEEIYQYDRLNRLVSRVRTGSGSTSEAFQYDVVGNRTRSTDAGGTTDFVYDVNDRLVEAAGARFSYDANGNRVSGQSGGQDSGYTWDARGRLESVTLNGTRTSFGYDALGNRAFKRTGATEARYVVDTNSITGLPQVAQRRGTDGQVAATFAYGTDLLSEDGPSGTRYYHQDGLGSTSVSTDAAGGSEDTYRYSSYGEAETVASGELNYGFTGEEYDAETGLQYLRARYYDAETGVFLSEDPLLGEIRDPVTRHRYLYAASNPVNFVDPTGQYTMPELSVSQFISTGIRVVGPYGAALCTAAGVVKEAATLKALVNLGFQAAKFQVSGKIAKDAKVTLLDFNEPESRYGLTKAKVELTGEGMLDVEVAGTTGPTVKFSVNLKTGKVAGGTQKLDVPLLKADRCGAGFETNLTLLGESEGKVDTLSSIKSSGGLPSARKRPLGFRITIKGTLLVSETQDYELTGLTPGEVYGFLNDVDRGTRTFLDSRINPYAGR
jgi:RHS repeat-associated protein